MPISQGGIRETVWGAQDQAGMSRTRLLALKQGSLQPWALCLCVKDGAELSLDHEGKRSLSIHPAAMLGWFGVMDSLWTRSTSCPAGHQAEVTQN